MYQYLLLILPAFVAALVSPRFSIKSLLIVWGSTASLTLILMPIGSRDYLTYLQNFETINEQPLIKIILSDPLYAGSVWLFGHIGGSGEFFYAGLAALGLLIKLSAVRLLGGRHTLPVVLYMSSYFFLHDFTQIRAGFAIGLWMLALTQLGHGYSRYLLLTGIASLIHLQALLGLLLFGILILIRSRNNLRIAAFLGLVIILAAPTRVFDKWGYALLAVIPDPRTEIYLLLAKEDLWVRPNPFSVISLLALLIVFAGLWMRSSLIENPLRLRPITQSTSAAVFLALLLGSCSLALLSAVPVAAFRVSEHFFSLLPVGAWLVACRFRSMPRHTWPLWMLAILFLYIFLIYSPNLLDPTISSDAQEAI